MARKGYGDAIYYGAIIIGSYTAYKMGLQGSFGPSAKKFFEELSSAWKTPNLLAASTSGSSAPKTTTSQTSKPAATAPTTAMPAQAATSLRDMGGVPLVWVDKQQLLEQDPAWVSRANPGATPNTYGAGAVVFGQGSGTQLQYTGAGKLVNMDTNQVEDVGAYISAVA